MGFVFHLVTKTPKLSREMRIWTHAAHFCMSSFMMLSLHTAFSCSASDLLFLLLICSSWERKVVSFPFCSLATWIFFCEVGVRVSKLFRVERDLISNHLRF